MKHIISSSKNKNTNSQNLFDLFRKFFLKISNINLKKIFEISLFFEKSIKNRIVFIVLIVFMNGCRVGPQYSPPTPEVPVEWKNPSLEENPTLPTVCEWWEVFEDDRLNGLESQAVGNSPTLFTALARVQEAWALAGISRADLFPQLNLNPTFNDTHQSVRLKFKRDLPFLDSLPRSFHFTEYQTLVPLNLSYQIDLWGKYRMAYDSAVLNAKAQEEDYQVSLLTLTTDLASAYYHLRMLDSLIDLYRLTIEARQTEYNLNKSRFDKGLVTKIDVTNAELALANAQADYEDANRQRGITENMIATFIGLPASEFHLDSNPLEEKIPTIPAGLPSDVLLRRPDVAAAEREMASQHAQIGVAYASLFPSFELTGSLGFESLILRHFLDWRSYLWSLGMNATQTVFDAGRKFSDIEAAWARFYQTGGEYQQDVLVAFQEVEDALHNLEYQSRQANALKKAVNASVETVRLSKERYKRGLINYFEVVTNERAELLAQTQYVNVQGDRFQYTIQLIKALGGGWESYDSCVVDCP